MVAQRVQQPCQTDWRSPESEALFAELSELSPDWYWELDEKFRFSWRSPGFEKHTGQPASALIGKTPWETYGANSTDPRWRTNFDEMQRHEPFHDFEILFHCENGSPVWVQISGTPKVDAEGRFLGYRGIARNVTRMRLAEQRLKQSEERFRDFAHAGGDALNETNAEGRIVWIWKSDSEKQDVPDEWYLGRRRTELAQPGTDFTAEPWKSHLETLKRRESFRDFRYPINDPAAPSILSVSGIPYNDAYGKFLGYRNVIRNVTAHVMAEQAVNAADQRLRAAIENLKEIISLTDSNDCLVVANRGFREINAIAGSHLEPGTPFVELMRVLIKAGHFPQAIGREKAWLEDRMAARLNPQDAFEQERQDGRWVLINDQRLPDGGTITYGLDITELKRSEERRLAAARNQRDALIREVHHRIKNNLQGVVGLLMQNVYEHPELASLFQRAAAQVQLVATVHGLQSQSAGEMRLTPLVEAIARNVASLTLAEITTETASAAAEVLLAERESVAVALIVNELMFNAVKHSIHKQGVRTQVERLRDCIRLSIRNAGVLPPSFDYYEALGLGTGLELVHALMPANGMRLSFAQSSATEVHTSLDLFQPVIEL